MCVCVYYTTGDVVVRYLKKKISKSFFVLNIIIYHDNSIVMKSMKRTYMCV